MATIPGVLYVPNFLEEHLYVFEWTLKNVPWDERIKARKTASYGLPYNYAGLEYAECSFPPILDAVRQRASHHMGFEANNCLLNYYPDGRSRMGYHADRTEGLQGGVVIVSLGAQRTLRFRYTTDPDQRLDYVLASGSLLYLPPDVHLSWQHALPRCLRPEPRISLTFRSLILA